MCHVEKYVIVVNFESRPVENKSSTFYGLTDQNALSSSMKTTTQQSRIYSKIY
jgi:hypothetical protein